MSFDKIPYHLANSITFGVYSSEEINKLSVLEITNVNTFDALGHPTPGGLYDSALGPADRDEMCTTCGLINTYCPGHLGHIRLPLPVFNPVFIRTLYQLLRGSCFSCHSLLPVGAFVQLTLAQLQVLDYGLIGVAKHLEEICSDILNQQTGSSIETALQVKEKLKKYVDNSLKDLDLTEAKYGAHVKNVVECRQRIVKNFIKDCLMGPCRRCPHCGLPRKNIALRHNSRIIFTGTSSNARQRITQHSRNTSAFGEFEEADEDNEQSRLEENADLNNMTYVTPVEARNHLHKLWKKEKALLKRLFGVLNVEESSRKCPLDIFFLEIVVVPPSKFRPLNFVNGRKYENPQTAALNRVLQYSVLLRDLLDAINSNKDSGSAIEKLQDESTKALIDKIPGKTRNEKFHYSWHQLQLHVNCVVDSDMAKLLTDKIPGVKQILEKKQGLFRKHMMGKRVNYAARSVISPDPYIMVDEIGIPTIFAVKLTYPQPVTSWNVSELRQAVINGPNVYPGAVLVQNDDETIVKLDPNNIVKREAIAKQLLKPSHSYNGGVRGSKIVYRHLKNGDVLLLNRQPTLHKPSIMAHRARVLPGEKTLRLHYANCKSYNADFDGDEMNAHFPQSELARAEAYNLASVNYQYLVPKDGTPLSGLIQDHIIAGSLITVRGRFFSREDYQALVFGALTFIQKPIKLLPPTIRKPQLLWSGKQVVSTVIINIIPEGKPPPSIEGTSKIASKNWNIGKAREYTVGAKIKSGDMCESSVLIKNGELLCGVLDKAHFGPTPYGLVHCCYELYGGQTSSNLLTSLARLFTHFLQMTSGFTLGVKDILLTKKANKKRWKVMKKVRNIGDTVLAETFGISAPSPEIILERFQEAHLSADDNGLKQLDMVMKKYIDEFNDEINEVCIPNGLIKKFPSNNLQLMAQAGAKGTKVNTMQISCLLGQIDLEGRRVPFMSSGRTLPSFLSYDTSPRAGGFVDGRFLTGIRPQEYFFHCMAGREGLIDTAVKTSRSGYLQRCLIKHLEGITVNYDMTVRDSDGSVIQFQYGEDGLDILKMQMLKKEHLPLLIKNHKAIINENELKVAFEKLNPEGAYKCKKDIKKWKKKHNEEDKLSRNTGFHIFASEIRDTLNTDMQVDLRKHLCNKWINLDNKIKKKYNKLCKKCPDPVQSVLRPDVNFGAVSEYFDAIIENYISGHPSNFKSESEESDTSNSRMTESDFRHMMYQKYMHALAEPGEAVGLLAAQSVGEPSTQMTLNTFHFAGCGEMNVTLGIPRLREILMVASANIATPTMDLPVFPNAEDRAEKLRLQFTAVYLHQILEYISVKEHLEKKGDCYRIYNIRFQFLPHKAYKGSLFVNPSRILYFMERCFFKRLIDAIKKKVEIMTASSKLLKTSRSLKTSASNEVEENSSTSQFNLDAIDEGESSEEEGGDGDTASSKLKSRHDQELEYEEPEEEEKIDDQSDQENIDDAEPPEMRSEVEATEGEDEITTGQSLAQEKFSEKRQKHIEELKTQKPLRANAVCKLHPWFKEYNFDTTRERWCELKIELNSNGTKIDMATLLDEVAHKAVVHQTSFLKRAFLVKNTNPSSKCEKLLKTEGVNILETFKYDRILDLKKLYTNDIHAVAKTYGIEAAARTIVKEVSSVFQAYGIEVDPRHLLLVADYMTFDGAYRSCNRIGMENNASPLQQMTFETTMHFLKSATLSGFQDRLKSPSSRLIVGNLVSGGTGCFDLLQPRISLSSLNKNKRFQ